MLHPSSFPPNQSMDSSGSSLLPPEAKPPPMQTHSTSSSSSQEPVLVFHDSARNIVFRDHVLRSIEQQDGGGSNPVLPVVAVVEPHIVPLPAKPLGFSDIFQPLLDSDPTTQQNLTPSEQAVYQDLRDQRCVVKTIKNNDWTSFLDRFSVPQQQSRRCHALHADLPPNTPNVTNAFLTSTTLLPAGGYKMRCYGSTSAYTVGAIFALPSLYTDVGAEDAAAERTWTWSWPAGYAAKTEFNIDGRGRLINGRQEALVPLSVLRQYNDEYLHQTQYMVGLRKVSGLNQIPYNELYIRVGGSDSERSLDRGIGNPVALFVRTATYGHLMALLRTRARLGRTLQHASSLPLIFIDPVLGCRILTEELQQDLWKCAANQLNPFANPSISHKATAASLQQKFEELFEFDESIRSHLTPRELAALAGGFGASDQSVVSLLQHVLLEHQVSGLQEVVHEGLAAAVRAGDYHTSRQLLLLYSLVATQEQQQATGNPNQQQTPNRELLPSLSSPGATRSPPPPLDTSRLRSATNSDGLLAVLGSAQVLQAMQDGSAKQRVHEAVDSIDEWISCGEHSMAFRISSWYDQRAAQDELKIATDTDSRFMAFVSNKAVSNRKLFAQELRDAVSRTDFTNVRFLFTLHEMLSRMHSPCLRLELLQYVLGLDNRYSVAHVMRSVELATSCLEMTTMTTFTRSLTDGEE